MKSTKTGATLNIIAEMLDPAEQDVIRRSAENILRKLRRQSRGIDVYNFAETIWPAAVEEQSLDPELLLIPLSRLGAVQGFSGNRVMIGYFIDQTNKLMPSRPMVIKISSKGTSHKLLDEKKRADSVRLYLAYYPGQFALPLHCEVINGFGVLWSPFSSSTPLLSNSDILSSSRLALTIEDMWFHLRKSSPLEPSVTAITAEDALLAPAKDIPESLDRDIDLIAALEKVFESLKPLHMRGGKIQSRPRSLHKEYEKYLRGIDTWGEAWHSIWGSPAKKAIKVQGMKRINPLWVLDKIRKLKPTAIRCGAVHGDLHPRNILFSDQKSPHLIDFGWAEDNAHISKDFVLLECNVRFMVLRPEIPVTDMQKLCGWVSFSTAPTVADRYCRLRIHLIEKIRNKAREALHPSTNWDTEYLIPLFLVALGLLKHLRDTDNQASATATVLALSDWLAHSKYLGGV